MKHVLFRSAKSSKDWEYLTLAILETDIWKLQSIENGIYNDFGNKSSYFKIANYARKSLTTLKLARGMMKRADLAQFKQLISLAVGRDVFERYI